MMLPVWLVAFPWLLLAAPQRPAEPDPLVSEMRLLKAQVSALGLELGRQHEGLNELKQEVGGVRDELRGLRDRPAQPVAVAFLSGPPSSSDAVGVAKVVVFAPRVEVESLRRHDVVFLKVRRLEAAGARSVAEAELLPDQDAVALPLDQSGALYAVDWSTSEGHSYALILKDGATGLPAVTVQVKPLQTQGRFLFVGYRLD
jgi:hypothetical protein